MLEKEEWLPKPVMSAREELKEFKEEVRTMVLAFLTSECIGKKNRKTCQEIAGELYHIYGYVVTVHDVYEAKRMLCKKGNPHHIISNAKGYYISDTVQARIDGIRYFWTKWITTGNTLEDQVKGFNNDYPNRPMPSDIMELKNYFDNLDKEESAE